MKKTALLLATALFGLAGGGAQAFDSKTVPGYACQPQTTQISDFKYQVGGLTNKSFRRRIAVCPLIKDNNFTLSDVPYELADVEVHVKRSPSSISDFKCVLRVRNLSTGAVTAANVQTTTSTSPGNFRLDFNSLDAPRATEDSFGRGAVPGVRSTYDIVCIVPERATIRGVFWSEENYTDQYDAGF